VNISSAAGVRSTGTGSVYAMTKAVWGPWILRKEMLLKQGDADKIAVDNWILGGNLGKQERL